MEKIKSPTGILEAEHRSIEKVVSAASVIAARIEAGQEKDIATLPKIVTFMRTYADKCHHGKEEALLFPALLDHGVPAEGCPIGALMGEHKRGRLMVAELAEGADLYMKGDKDGKDKILRGLTGIMALYPNHIWKEDFLLFPMTMKVLDQGDQQALLEPFEKVDNEIGEDSLRDFEEFAEKMIASAD